MKNDLSSNHGFKKITALTVALWSITLSTSQWAHTEDSQVGATDNSGATNPDSISDSDQAKIDKKYRTAIGELFSSEIKFRNNISAFGNLTKEQVYAKVKNKKDRENLLTLIRNAKELEINSDKLIQDMNHKFSELATMSNKSAAQELNRIYLKHFRESSPYFQSFKKYNFIYNDIIYDHPVEKNDFTIKPNSTNQLRELFSNHVKKDGIPNYYQFLNQSPPGSIGEYAVKDGATKAADPNADHSIDSILINPIQRAPRYQLLMKAVGDADRSVKPFLQTGEAQAIKSATRINDFSNYYNLFKHKDPQYHAKLKEKKGKVKSTQSELTEAEAELQKVSDDFNDYLHYRIQLRSLQEKANKSGSLKKKYYERKLNLTLKKYRKLLDQLGIDSKGDLSTLLNQDQISIFDSQEQAATKKVNQLKEALEKEKNSYTEFKEKYKNFSKLVNKSTNTQRNFGQFNWAVFSHESSCDRRSERERMLAFLSENAEEILDQLDKEENIHNPPHQADSTHPQSEGTSLSNNTDASPSAPENTPQSQPSTSLNSSQRSRASTLAPSPNLNRPLPVPPVKKQLETRASQEPPQVPQNSHLDQIKAKDWKLKPTQTGSRPGTEPNLKDRLSSSEAFKKAQQQRSSQADEEEEVDDEEWK
jgi:hypothetical protein